MQYLNLNLNDLNKLDLQATRDGFGVAMVDIARQDSRIIALCADVTEALRLDNFKKAYPDRFVELGVAEQNLVGVASGLALSGKIPFASAFAAFNPGRNLDQIRISICYSNANVKIIGSHSGLSVGPDGATHQALEDIALMRTLPNMTVISPCDANEAYQAVIAAAHYLGPVYIRLTRPKTPLMTNPGHVFSIGKSYLVMGGQDITIITTGPIAYEGIQAALILKKQNITADVVFTPTIKPLDTAPIVSSVKKTGAVITLEDHQIDGGLGSAICEALAENYPVPIERIGMPNTFGESGEYEALWHKYGLDRHGVVKAANRLIKRK